MRPPLSRVIRELLGTVNTIPTKTGEDSNHLAAETATSREPAFQPDSDNASATASPTSSAEAITEILTALGLSLSRNYFPLTESLRPIFKGRAGFVAALIIGSGTVIAAVAPWQRVSGSAPNFTPTAGTSVLAEPSSTPETGLLTVVVTATPTSSAKATSTASLPAAPPSTPIVSPAQPSPVSGPRADIVSIEKRVESVSYTAARVRAVVRFTSNECMIVYLMIKRWHDDVQTTGELFDWQSPQEVCPGKSSAVIVDLALHVGTGRLKDCGMPYEVYLTAVPQDVDQDWKRRYVSQGKPIPAQAAPLAAKKLTKRGETIIPGEGVCAGQVGAARPTAAPSPEATPNPATTEPALSRCWAGRAASPSPAPTGHPRVEDALGRALATGGCGVAIPN
jgi:hypothetical protein